MVLYHWCTARPHHNIPYPLVLPPSSLPRSISINLTPVSSQQHGSYPPWTHTQISKFPCCTARTAQSQTHKFIYEWIFLSLISLMAPAINVITSSFLIPSTLVNSASEYASNPVSQHIWRYCPTFFSPGSFGQGPRGCFLMWS